MNATQKEVLAMTEEQFRRFMVAQLNSMQRERADMRTAIEENTTITRNTNEKLASVFAIMNFSENSAKRIIKFGRILSATAKVILPIVALYGAVVALTHGQIPSLKDLF